MATVNMEPRLPQEAVACDMQIGIEGPAVSMPQEPVQLPPEGEADDSGSDTDDSGDELEEDEGKVRAKQGWGAYPLHGLLMLC